MTGTGSGGETKSDPSGWTVDTLRAMMEARISEMDKRYEQRFTAQQDAIVKSDIATEKRFDSVNEFRGQLSDQAARFMPRIESIQRHDSTAEKIADLDQRQRQDVALINSRLDLNAGRTAGIGQGWAVLIGAVGLVGGVIAIIITFAQ